MIMDSTRRKEAGRRTINRIALVAEWTCVAGIAFVGASVAYLWLDNGRLFRHLAREAPMVVSPPSEAMLLLAGTVAIIPAALFMIALWQTRSLFGHYRRGEMFTGQIPGILVRLGYLAIGATLAGVLARTLVTILLTLGNPPGQRHLAIGISSTEVFGLIVGFLFFCFAQVARESRRIADENEGFI